MNKKFAIPATVFCSLLFFLNIIVSNDRIINYIASYSPVNYFYITHHWKLRHIKALNLKAGDAAIFGSSRSIYGVDPRDLHATGDVYNLGLMGANQKDVLHLLKKVSSPLDYIILEFNPASLSHRQLERSDFLEKEVNFSKFLNRIPLIRYREIFGETIEKLLQGKWLKEDPVYNVRRNKIRRKEFHQLDNRTHHGHLSISSREIQNLSIVKGMTEECHIIHSWSLDSKSFRRGKDLFRKSLEAAKKRTDHVVIYIPPSAQYEKSRKNIAPLYRWLMKLAKSEHISVFDYRDLKVDFFDCTHPDSNAAKKISRRLKKQLEVIIEER